MFFCKLSAVPHLDINHHRCLVSGGESVSAVSQCIGQAQHADGGSGLGVGQGAIPKPLGSAGKEDEMPLVQFEMIALTYGVFVW